MCAALAAFTVNAASAPAEFRFAEVDARSLGLWQGTNPVFVYNHGVILKAGVPADRARSSYLHPLYGLDGEVLTDDFPEDHLHHRGLFWAWPHVRVGDQHHDLWMLQGIRHEFRRWLARKAGPDGATLEIENGWRVGGEPVMSEHLRIRTHPVAAGARAIDLAFTWTPLRQPITLAGAEGKSYGGLTLRFAPRMDTVITTPLGAGAEDLAMTRLPWADFSGRFGPGKVAAGAAVFIAPDHPDFPPMWLTRHYGALCVGWPGIEPRTFLPGQEIHAAYRIWIHRGMATSDDLTQAFAAFRSSPHPASAPPPGSGAGTAPSNMPQRLRAEVRTNAITVFIEDRLFTEYRFPEDAKSPHFFPVNGPRSGRTVTVREAEPYPHHSSIFFGCDRVNGGNYWQEGLERGRIRSESVRLVQAEGREVVIEQACVWERPGAASPFLDQRRIAISAPSAARRIIDFEIALTAQTEVRIEQSNHSLFAVRVAPDLAVRGGGRLVNDAGDRDEAGTFGKPSAWLDARGPRGDAIEGITLFNDPRNPWSPPRWFTRDYGFLSPTPMNWLPEGRLDLPQGTTLRLRYRVLVHADDPGPQELQRLHLAWSGS